SPRRARTGKSLTHADIGARAVRASRWPRPCLRCRRNAMHLKTRAESWAIVMTLLLLVASGRAGADDHVDKDVSPAASTPWRAPDLGAYTKALRSEEATPIDPQKQYELPELVDLAERLNPETRVAWEHARQAATAVGLVQSEYWPILSLNALGGYHSEATPAPQDVAPSGFFRVDLEQARPTLNLEWLLLDFGRRGSTLDAAKQRLLAANLGFNRKHQEIVYRVRRAFVARTSLTAKIAVAQSAVDSARAVREAAESRLRNGLATRPEVALARQQEAQAAFDL